MITCKPHIKFEIIHELESQEDCSVPVSELCLLAGVSRSGYYRWKTAVQVRERKEIQDQSDFALIQAAYQSGGYHKGAKGIHMVLLHQNPPLNMNLKKIRRLMKKYRLICPIRQANPYRKMAKATKESNFADYLLKRRFTEFGPRRVLLTDITYIPFNDGCKKFAYLSTIIDAFTRQVLAYKLSNSLEIDFVLETVNDLIDRHGITLSTETLINSDQGSHYTSCKFSRLLKDAGLRQSMSRRGCCWDNAPQESFFGHMKDEINIDSFKSFEDVKSNVDSWITYYNKQRYQWQLAKLSPDEFYKFISSGIYPLNLNTPPHADFYLKNLRARNSSNEESFN